MTLTIFDTSIGSSNLGDLIIMDAVNKEIDCLFSDSMILRSSTHMKMGRETYKMVLGSDLCFVGGTNLISSAMQWHWQWRINFIDSIFVNNIILLGVGWWQHQGKPNLYTSMLLKRVLDGKYLHSVRDSYTEKRLLSAGIKNVVNTGCPTLWSLDEKHCQEIPHKKGDSVLFTLTDYKKDATSDRLFIDLLQKKYETLYFWPQGLNDQKYLKSLGFDSGIRIVSPSLKSLDEILLDQSIALDYVGTRLHGGIRALQSQRRSIIIGIDNRASEKAKDFNLAVVPRGDIQALEEMIGSSFETAIKLPYHNIQKWKDQFH